MTSEATSRETGELFRIGQCLQVFRVEFRRRPFSDPRESMQPTSPLLEDRAHPRDRPSGVSRGLSSSFSSGDNNSELLNVAAARGTFLKW
jgi:hypothetical protein